ncbi:MAG: hypothetical protein QM725_14220 [Lacibacter sp.]
MKKFLTATVLVMALMLSSCEPAVTFNKPQPDTEKPLIDFPDRLHGNYLSEDQASVITITDSVITRHYEFDYSQHKDSIGASCKIVGDSLVNTSNGIKEKISLQGDSLIHHESWTDTLFRISDENVLKKFRGYYFLNNRFKDKGWEVKQMWLKKGVLTIGSISDKSDIQKLKEITETTADTTSTTFSITKKQLKQFVKQDGFGNREKFTRIKTGGR